MNISDTMVELKDIHLTLPGGSGPVNILDGVNLHVAPGETVSVVGPSGSGKTTMLMIAAGLERPTSGVVRVAGTDFSRLDEDGLARFRRENVGIVFQAFHLVPTMTALENVALPLEFGGFDDPFERAAQALEGVGLASRMHHYPSQLSGGEQQRVAVARAFGPRPRLLMADEPTGNLDPETGKMIMDLLMTMQQETQTTLLLITHDRALADMSSRTVTMRGGKLV